MSCPPCLSPLKPESWKPRLDWLLRRQQRDGSWPAFLGDEESSWTTALALSVLNIMSDVVPAREKAFHWLLEERGREAHWFWRWKFKIADRNVRFNPDKYGWPWSSGSASWVIPTAFSVIAIKQFTACNRSRLSEKRIRLGVDMLLDRACAGGGWNSGNSVVYGVPLPAHVEATAIALLALQDEERTPVIRASLAWLKQKSASHRVVESLAWCILSLFVYQEPVEHLKARLGDARRRRPRHSEQCHSRHRDPGTEMWRDDSSVRGAAMNIDRRRFVGSAAGMAATTGVAADWFWPKHSVSYRRPRSFVAILNASRILRKDRGAAHGRIAAVPFERAGKRVLLKPNLVEDLPGPVNTNANIIGAAARCFLRLGAARVVIGEGPGHQRDTELVVQAANLKPHLADRRIEFVDLNRDELARVKLKANYSGLGELWLPRTVLDSDFVVSMPKVKTHHWAGVTLSLKNMFGIVPGMKYGWPKNLLHWHGIHESILDICATVPIHFVIADGITAMEGNGPLQGTARDLGKIVLADDPVAADATCARLMGLDPLRVQHLSEGGRFLGNLRADRITMLGERVEPPIRPFAVLPDFHYLLARTVCDLPVKSSACRGDAFVNQTE